MTERDDQPAAENTREGQQHLRNQEVEGASRDSVGALDGPAGAASLGADSDLTEAVASR